MIFFQRTKLRQPRGQRQLLENKQILRNILRFLTLRFRQIAFLMTCQQHKCLILQMLLAQADDLLYDNLKQDMCDVLGSVCLGAIMGNEVMFQYENSKFFDLCGVGGANNIIWNNVISDKNNGSDEDSTHLSPICAAVTTCHRVHFGHLLKVFNHHVF